MAAALVTEAQRALLIETRRRGGLSVLTVYQNPTDYPGQCVARHWAMLPRGELEVAAAPWAVAPTLEAVRAALPHEVGPVRFARAPGDEPQIVESWLL